MKHFTVLHKLIRTISVLLLAFIATAALQAQENIINVGANNVAEVITIPKAGHTNTTNYVITGTTTVKTITIKSGYQGTITLRNLNITKLSGNSNPPINVLGLDGRSNLDPITKVKIILEGNNSLELRANCSRIAAFQVNQGAQIEINAIDPNNNSTGILNAKSTPNEPGTVTTHPETGAGIGAPTSSGSQGTALLSNGYTGNIAGGNIIIGSGTITAWGGHGAGIGGGYTTYYDGVIIVYGGRIEARAGRHAAGIGSGCPTGTGVISIYTPNSTIVSLPPVEITGFGADTGKTQLANLALAGARNIIYMNDPNKSTITVHTEDYEKNADIYVDLSEAMATPAMKLSKLFSDLGINYDLKKVRLGRTSNNGLFVFNAEFKDKTTFFTDASSTSVGYEGRPYMPEDVNSIIGNKNNKVDIELERLKADISFSDTPSKPLEVAYTTQQAWDNAHRILIEYNDNGAMTNVNFQLQSELQLGVTSDFTGMKFLAADGFTVLPTPPTTLNKGDKYYIVMPIVQGKGIGIYSDVLLISAEWGGQNLPGYIRRIGMQRVVKNDTGINEYIKVKADPPTFVDYTFPATKTVKLTLNIDHKDTGINYDKYDVTAKYLITREPDYDTALATAPITSHEWKNMNVPANNAQDQTTIVSFDHLPHGIYYIHWYVESGVVYAHSTNAHNGFGPYVITDPIKAGELTGNPLVCEGQIPSEIKGEPSGGGSGNFSYQWEISTDGFYWMPIFVDGNQQNYTPTAPLTASPTYFRRVTLDNIYGQKESSNVFAIYIVPSNLTLYWNKNAMDNNWNNPFNWTDASGIVQNMVPLACTDVYIPGGIANYPSLDPNKTPIDIYGAPICNNITFAYGAELKYQHKLTYQKAHIQYNWGYYGNFSGVNSGDQPSGNSCSPASVQKREVWYALAAPLKSMATGDFAFAGYPVTWQAGFALSNPTTGNKGVEIAVGDFTKKFSKNDVPLSETNNAIAVKVPAYRSTIGSSDHSNLEGLKGIIEIPYFENNSKSEFYPGHLYDRFTKESKFFYFNPQTLQLLHSPIGKMERADEAYRFIYEKDGLTPEIDVAGVPSKVPGYKLKVERQNKTSFEVMIGNPFMASINAKQFFDVNKNKLEELEGYLLFDSNDQTWKHHRFAAAGNIPPLQAFIVTLKANEVELLFPLEGTYALTPSSLNIVAPAQGRSLYLKSQNSLNLEGDYSILARPEANETVGNVKKMISSEGHATPETFFISPNNKEYNLIQTYEKGLREIGIGVKTSDTKSTQWLTFENVDKFYSANGLRPVLVDKFLGVKQDLTVNNVYPFTQRQIDFKVKYIDSDRFVLRLLSSDEQLEELDTANISIVYNNKKLEVKALQNIKEIQIYDTLGRQIYLDANVNSAYYINSLSLAQGVYIVKVYTENGGTKAEKIMVP